MKKVVCSRAKMCAQIEFPKDTRAEKMRSHDGNKNLEQGQQLEGVGSGHSQMGGQGS